MKIKILIFILVIFVISACTQRSCPTYAKSDIKTINQSK